MKKTIVSGFLLILLVVVFSCSYQPSEQHQKVQFEFVGCFAKKKAIQWDYWFMVNDLKGTDITSEILADFCDIESIKMDFERYTYIVADGHEMVDLYYTFADGSRHFSASPDYYGYATLQGSDETKVYVYRIPVDTPVVKDIHAHYEDDFRTTILP